MRKSEAFNKGKKDGKANKEPNPVGGKTAYVLGYNIGYSEFEQQQMINFLNKKNSVKCTAMLKSL